MINKSRLNTAWFVPDRVCGDVLAGRGGRVDVDPYFLRAVADRRQAVPPGPPAGSRAAITTSGAPPGKYSSKAKAKTGSTTSSPAPNGPPPATATSKSAAPKASLSSRGHRRSPACGTWSTVADARWGSLNGRKKGSRHHHPCSASRATSSIRTTTARPSTTPVPA
jgi:hypothetical protein